MRHESLPTNGIRLHCVTAGPKNGPLVVLLHGFPEFWYGWRHQIPFLAKKGFRVLAPDQRGYNLSDKPKGIASYQIKHCVEDVVGLIESQKRDRAIVIGHDWGGAVAWQSAMLHPQRVEKLVILNAPHPAAFTQRLLRSFSQLRKSWYMFFFQLPWLPEYLLKQRNWALQQWFSFRTSSVKKAFSAKDHEQYRTAWNQPSAMTSMIHWYRNLFRSSSLPILLDRSSLEAPTLLIWGRKDAYLGSELAEASIRKCKKGRLVFLEEASHWIQHEFPERVNALIDDFIRPSSGRKNVF